MKVPLDAIEMNGPAPGAGNLKRSLEQRGQLYPVLLQKVGDRYRILDGRRRVAAARALGWKAIEAEVIEGDERDTLAANLARSKNPVAEFLAIKALKEKGLTHAEIAKEIGVSRVAVTHRLRLEKLIPELLEALATGRLSYSAAREAAVLDVETQKALARRLEKGEKLGAREVRGARDATHNGTADPLAQALAQVASRENAPDPNALLRADVRRLVEMAKTAGVPLEALLQEVQAQWNA